MDEATIRQIAVEHFLSGSSNDIEEWEVEGPREVEVGARNGKGEYVSETWWCVDFVPRPDRDPSGRRFTLSVGVNPVSGQPDMFR